MGCIYQPVWSLADERFRSEDAVHGFGAILRGILVACVHTMMMAPSSRERSHFDPRGDRKPRLALIMMAFAFPWIRLIYKPYPINHDVAWFYYVARGITQGGILYRDFIEPNAPLASLSMVPAVGMANVLHTSPAFTIELYVLAICAGILSFDAILLQRLGIGLAAQAWFLSALAIEIVFLPRASFGQREHILFILLTPYAIGALCSVGGHTLRPGLAFFTGLLAAIGVGLKPPFLLVPCLIEVFVLFRLGPRSLLRAQMSGLVAGAAAIAGATVLLFPAYLREVVPWAVQIYGGYNEPGKLWFYASICLVGFGLAWGALGFTRGRDVKGLRAVLAASFAGCMLAFIVQGKGWAYQMIPAYLTVILSLACACGALISSAIRDRFAILRLMSGAVLAYCCLFLSSGMATGFDPPPDPGRFAGVANEVAATRGPFVIFSTDVSPGIPLALVEGHVWASRFPCMIMLPGFIKSPPSPSIAALEKDYRASIVADLERYRPNLIMMPVHGDQALPANFDILAWLLRDAAFGRLWGQYAEGQPIDGFRVFRGHWPRSASSGEP